MWHDSNVGGDLSQMLLFTLYICRWNDEVTSSAGHGGCKQMPCNKVFGTVSASRWVMTAGRKAAWFWADPNVRGSYYASMSARTTTGPNTFPGTLTRYDTADHARWWPESYCAYKRRQAETSEMAITTSVRHDGLSWLRSRSHTGEFLLPKRRYLVSARSGKR